MAGFRCRFKISARLASFSAVWPVVLSLVYLAVQIRQNTSAVRNSMFHEVIRDQVSAMDQLNPNPELNRIYYEGMKDFDSLLLDEQRRFATYLTSVLRRYENVLYQTRHGTLDPGSWVGTREHLRYVFSQPGTMVWWKRAKNLFHSELVAFIENEIVLSNEVISED